MQDLSSWYLLLLFWNLIYHLTLPPNALGSFWRLQSLLKSSDIYTHSGNVFMRLTTPLITGLRPHISGTKLPRSLISFTIRFKTEDRFKPTYSRGPSYPYTPFLAIAVPLSALLLLNSRGLCFLPPSLRLYTMSSNTTLRATGQGQCPTPFLDAALFPSTGGCELQDPIYLLATIPPNFVHILPKQI
jgi:hypothetical protein